MDSIITWAKENFDFISLLIGFIGIVIGVIGVISAKRSRKNEIRKEKYLDDFKKAMAEKSVEALIEDFNREVGSNAWASMRAYHDFALIETLIDKGIDVSAIYDGKAISFARHIALNDDKTKVVCVE